MNKEDADREIEDLKRQIIALREEVDKARRVLLRIITGQIALVEKDAGRLREENERLRQQVDTLSGARVVFVHEEGAQERFLTQEEHRANRPVEEDQKELMSLQECVLDLEAVIEDKLQKRRLQQA